MVLLALVLPLTLFSVYTFQSKGNLIILIFYAVMMAIRWCGGLALLAWGSVTKTGWENMWELIQGGDSNKCLIESCGGI